MLRKFCILIVCVPFALALACSEKADSPKEIDIRQLSQAELSLATSSNEFGINLFQKLVEQNPDSSIFISPLSVSMAFGMALNGASGATRDSLEQTLRLSGLSPTEINESYRSLIDFLATLDQKVTFELANSMWPRLGFAINDEFVAMNRSFFDAEVRALDFDDPGSVDIINEWIEEKTHDKITDMLDYIPGDAVLYLINAIYFNGFWTTQFDKENTIDGVFRLQDGSSKICKMMNLETTISYLDADGFSAVELPYGSGDYSMVILLPDEDRTVDEVIGAITDENWNAWMGSFTEVEEALLSLPKFEFEYFIKLNDALKALGMSIAFSGLADFSNICAPGTLCDLYISRVLHKAFIRVDEEGTEAAAATIIEFRETSVGPSVSFVVDRPFAIVIREARSGSMLFMGKMLNPEFSE